MLSTAPDGRAGIDAALVKRLISTQFPRWGRLPVVPVAVDGWDNRTYRLGEDMTVRLPTAAGYAPAVDKECDWLPRLAPFLPTAVPAVLAKGAPGEGYPYSWSVRRWLPGETASPERIDDMARFATDVARFILALQRCDATDGPLAGEHSFYRGASPAHYDDETHRCVAALGDRVDKKRATEVWQAALAAEWRGEPVWFHGDLAAGNLLVDGGELSAVIDFGTSGVGDPACDLTIAWTMFREDSRAAFRQAVGQDDGTWARARGWALWKSALTVAECPDPRDERVALHLRVIDAVLADHERFA
ncbi:aminoglycoside phosphotransferase family protein [Streptomyces sp. 35G-GA-8]|uniref:aminoglycoside phosphotransferase family protein n=1 Tax=Streptomyces sp. 35G-GA-8 TaxID=2939434 RepID=UPI00201EDD77|nr:aminoglycoside phosphotransferase family protein [Streptomyces sp. 35G-GA-8]MCL7382448.1 aminoglycoside phosphotransferase family protein [Streptomyces sp. 35G-GA-8]